MMPRSPGLFPRTLSTPYRRFVLAVALVAGAVLVKVFLMRYANLEPVLAASLLAGCLLGGWYTVAVPLAVMLVLQPLEWGGLYPGYALDTMAGITFFVVTGFVFVGLVGKKVKPRILFRVGSLALLTSISVPLTIAYDLWTDVGDYYFLLSRTGVTFWQVLEAQVPFTLIHILSSLVFVPLFGAIFLLANHALTPASDAVAVPEPTDTAGAADRGPS